MLLLCGIVNAQRNMEKLGRGVVAVRTGTTSAFISWRLLGLDPAGIGFNVYRSTAGGTAVKLNGTALTGGTNYSDASADLTKDNSYFVKPVVSGAEQAASGSFNLTANHTTEPCVVVPLRTPAAGYFTKFVSVGDLDGDGEYDYIVDRIAPLDTVDDNIGLANQKLEAYKSDGTFLWSMDLGITSRNTYNITPGAATISMGMWDGFTVYDIDSDGKAEVIIKTANDVTFGDGKKLTDSNPSNQYISVLNGMTGSEEARIQLPTDYIAQGTMGAQLAIAHLNGTTPSIVAFMKNRNADKSFNAMICAWDFNGSAISLKWKWLRGNQNCEDGHTMRIVDVDGDGKDEICEIGFCLNGDGTLRYSLYDQGVIHGDRFYVGKFDQTRAGLQGYGIQQNNPNGLLEYYYDANTGKVLWKHTTTPPAGDVGRGLVGDIDPRSAGYEVWSFSGLYNGPSNTQLTTTNYPYPCQTFWWDGDLLSEGLNAGKFEKWDYLNQGVNRLLTNYKFETATGTGTNPMFMGDIFGDWRTEVVYTSSDYSKLVIFSTNIPTDSRIYTMAHNPSYRNQLTIKGYLESPLVDYYLGSGMATPPTPNIRYVGSGTASSTYQGEANTAMSGVIITTNQTGYTGTGFADYGGNGTWIEWNNVWAQVTGAGTMVITYANGAAANRQCDVTINGTSVGNVAFTSSTGWNRWATATITGNFKAGYNTVRITANTTNGGPNIDKMDVTTVKSAQDNPDIEPSVAQNEETFSIYPNPLEGSQLWLKLNLAVRSEVLVSITDFAGRVVLQSPLGAFDAGYAEKSIDLGSLPKGIYILSIQTAGGSKLFH